MIISDRYRFVFFQVPQTASSFLGEFFSNKYQGRPILEKHSTCLEFLEIATPEQETYRRIIGKRNPLDKLVTQYLRTMNLRGIKHGSIEETQIHFEQWFQQSFIKREKRYSTPHVVESYPFVDYTISQENLEQDLIDVLRKMNLGKRRIPGWEKRTTNKLSDYTQYFSKTLIPLVLDVYSYEMRILNYEIPEAWRELTVNE